MLAIRCYARFASLDLGLIRVFRAELMVDFPVVLENPHVISPKQVWVGVVEKGPGGCRYACVCVRGVRCYTVPVPCLCCACSRAVPVPDGASGTLIMLGTTAAG